MSPRLPLGSTPRPSSAGHWWDLPAWPLWFVWFLWLLSSALIVLLHDWLGFTASGHPTTVFFLLPVSLCAYRGGLWHGLASTILGVLVAAFFTIPPLYSFQVHRLPDQARVLAILAVGGFLSVLFDSLRLAGARAERRESLLATTLASIGDAVITTSSTGFVTFLNHEAENLTGWSLSEALGQPLSSVLPLPLEGALLERATLSRRNGTSATVDARLSPIQAHDGSILGSVVVFHDRSAAIAAELSLQRSQELYRTVTSNISDVIWILDVNTGSFRYVSPSVERLRGFTPEQVLSQPASEALTPASQAHLSSVLPARLAAFAQGSHEVYVDCVEQSRADGSTVWTETTTRFASNSSNGHIEVFGASRDITERMRAEADRDASRARLASLFANMLDGYCYCRMIWDGDTPVDFINLEVNDSFSRLTGLSNSIGVPVTKLIPGIRESNPEMFELYGRVARGGPSERLETFVPGLGKWFDAAIYCPEPGHFVSVFDDVTQRKLNEEALGQTYARLHLALEAARAGAWEWNLQTNENFWSDEIWPLYGLDPNLHTPSYQTWRSIIHPDDCDAAEQAVQQAASSGSTLRAEWRIVLPSGAVRWLATRGRPILSSSGAITHYIGIVFDVTERKAMENALRDSEERFRVFMDTSPVIAWIKDRDGRYLYTNRAFRYHLPVPDGRSSGFTDDDIYSPSDAARFRAEDASLFLLNGPIEQQQHTLSTNGVSSEWLKLKFLTSDSSGHHFAAGVAVDITETHNARLALADLAADLERRVAARTASLELANRELEAFSYSVSHDLRAPLRAIHGFSRCLVTDFSPLLNETAKDYLHRILAASERMGLLIDDLLELSRLSRSDLRRSPVDASALASEILSSLLSTQDHSSASSSIQPGILLHADPNLLRVALENLFSNAVKFSSQTSAPFIEFGSLPGSSVCFVRDNGAGFDMQYAQRLFGAFQRLHSQREFPGTGIGLATVQRIVHRHGGRIWAESAPGRGATFFFSFPDPDPILSSPGASS